MKCEDNEKPELMCSNSVVSLGLSSFPLIKEEIKIEPDCYATQLKLESINEPLIRTIIKSEQTFMKPDNDMCEEHSFNNEICFDESYIDNSENKLIEFSQPITNETKKKVELQRNDEILKNTALQNIFPNLFQRNGKNYNCDDYSKTVAKKSSHKMYLRTHSKQSAYKCDVCGKCFTVKDYLRAHIQTHSRLRPHKCKVCDKGFNIKNKLKIHILTHSEQRPYKCDMCGDCFKTKDHIKNHILTHSLHKPHKCEVCGICFNRKGNLNTHVLTHSGQRSHSCNVCGKRFTNVSNLRAHSLTHSGHKPLKCDVCGKCFTTKETILSHFARNHGLLCS